MYCNKCGSEIDINANFCNKCGNKLKNYNTASIIFERENQFYGVIVPIKVYLDGQLVASVNAGKSVKVQTTVGKHRIAFNLWSGNGQYDIEVNKENPNIKVTFKLGVGAITSKPKIVSITNV